MCGRFVNHLADMHRWAALLKGWPAGGALSYNVAPTTQVPLLTAQGSQMMSWGLVPAWSKEAKTQYATFNARLESAAEKPAFRNAWRAKRTCIVPMRGYYEWRVEGVKNNLILCSMHRSLYLLRGYGSRAKGPHHLPYLLALRVKT